MVGLDLWALAWSGPVHGGMSGLQADPVALMEEELHRRFIVDQRHHDIAIACGRLLPDDHDVPIEDALLGHRVTAHPQRKERAIARDQLPIDVVCTLVIFDRMQRNACGDGTHQRDADRVSPLIWSSLLCELDTPGGTTPCFGQEPLPTGYSGVWISMI